MKKGLIKIAEFQRKFWREIFRRNSHYEFAAGREYTPDGLSMQWASGRTSRYGLVYRK